MRVRDVCAGAAALLALFVGVLPYSLTVVPLGAGAAPNGTQLLDPSYDIKDLAAPAASGTMLRILSSLFKSRFIGPLLARMLLNDNKVWRLRELSLQVPQTVPHRPMPIVRLNSSGFARHVALAASHPGATAPPASAALDEAPRRWSVRDFHAAYAARRASPTAVASALLAAVPRVEAAVGTVFVSLKPEQVLREAQASEARWAEGKPLSVWDGVPVGIKDMIDIKGHMTGFGTWRGDGKKGAARAVAAEDDPIVRRFREAGAILVGLTTMTEYGVTPLGWSVHAQGPRNPHNPSHYSGGSSGGSAVAVATGLVPVAVTFDGGGSTRIPAALSGVHGLMAGFGRIPFRTDAESSCTHAGPVGTNTADLSDAYMLMASARKQARRRPL
jgi:hypothetical protein